MVYSHYAVTAIVVGVVFPILATAAIVARIKSRKIKALALQADDYFTLVAMVEPFLSGL